MCLRFYECFKLYEDEVLGYETRLGWGDEPWIGVYDLLCLPSVAVLLHLLCHFLTFYESTYHTQHIVLSTFFLGSGSVPMLLVSATMN